MQRTLFYTLLFLNMQTLCVGQILPAENSQLNYRMIGFSFPSISGIKAYKIEIAEGNILCSDSFKKHIVYSRITPENKFIVVVPHFGSDYTWRVSGPKKGGNRKPDFHHFSTMKNNNVDTSRLRLSILQGQKDGADGYLTTDAGGVIYNMSGEALWFLPDKFMNDGYFGNMKLTKGGTLTFMGGKYNYEIDYNGNVLWKSPNTGQISGDSVRGEIYHHDFAKLSNGHYLMMGWQYQLCKLEHSGDTEKVMILNEKMPHDGYRRGRFSTLIEYDKEGNIVWTWNSKNYLKELDFAYSNTVDSVFRFDPHENAFYFDEQQHCIYLGFKTLSRIIKIDYPSGRVTATYGHIFKPGIASVGNDLFCYQHTMERTKDEKLLVFNNNSCCNRDSFPTLMLLKEPEKPGEDIKKVWEYVCTTHDLKSRTFNSGGNAMSLPQGKYFVNMGSDYSMLFIVDSTKTLQWSALPERNVEGEGRWVPIKEYRSYWNNSQDIERFVWGAGN